VEEGLVFQLGVYIALILNLEEEWRQQLFKTEEYLSQPFEDQEVEATEDLMFD
jgi:hypothetical protein